MEFLQIKTPGVKLGNASDEDIAVVFDSQEKVFPAGEVVELEGHLDFPRGPGGRILVGESRAVDAFGRAVPNHGQPIPKEGASSVDIAKFCLEKAGPLGLYHVTGDPKIDENSRKTARELGIKNRIVEAERIMGSWRQTCREAVNLGTPIPPMPEHVAKADRFLLNHASKAKASIKRFQIKLDGASYDLLEEAKKHIFERPQYTEYRENWKAHVVDRFGDDEPVEKPEKAEKGKK